MELLRNLVRDLALIVVLASFLDMFLPSGAMRSFARVVMGLFMIFTVLNPMLSFAKQDFTFPTFTVPAMSSSATEEALAQGEEMARRNRELALDDLRRNLAQQVKAMAEMNGKIVVYDVQVELDSGEDSSGRIKKLSLIVGADNTTAKSKESWIAPVSPVRVSGEEKAKAGKTGKGGSELSSRDKNRLAQTLADFYNLKPGQIRISTN